MKRYLLLSWLFFCLLPSFSSTLPLDVYNREDLLKDFFRHHFENEVLLVFDDEHSLLNVFGNEGELFSQLKSYAVLEEKSQAILASVWYNENMFVALSRYKVFKPIKAFSLDGGIRFTGDELPVAIRLIEGMYQSDYNNLSEVSTKSTATASVKKRGDITMYGPWLNSLFGQVNCNDASGKTVNVTNYYTPSNYAAGCVAITLTTVLDYFKWPPIGVGTSSYSDTQGNSTGTYAANYGGRFYDWDNVLNRYDNRASTDDQRKALGKIAYDASVGLRTNYESTGSSADILNIPSIITAFFRFSYANYLTVSSSSFWTQVDRNMIKRIPVPFAISSSSGSVAHAIVCDGLYYDNATPDDKMYHLNMGWWGDGNGWFDIQGSFNASSYSTITAGVFNFTPIPYANEVAVISSSDSILVSWQFPEVENHKLEGFELQMHNGDENWEDVAALDSGVFNYAMQSDWQSAYYFRVRAMTRDYTSYYSNTVLIEDYPASLDEQGLVDGVQVYPSLASTVLNLDFGAEVISDQVDVQVYSLSGLRQALHLVWRSNKEAVLDVSHLETGNYVISIVSKENRITRQFIKRN